MRMNAYVLCRVINCYSTAVIDRVIAVLLNNCLCFFYLLYTCHAAAYTACATYSEIKLTFTLYLELPNLFLLITHSFFCWFLR